MGKLKGDEPIFSRPWGQILVLDRRIFQLGAFDLPVVQFQLVRYAAGSCWIQPQEGATHTGRRIQT
jgi:hypothetical protein